MPVQNELENSSSILKASPQGRGKSSPSAEEISNKKKKRITPVPISAGNLSTGEASIQVRSPQTGMGANIGINESASKSRAGGIAMLAAAAGKNAALGKP